MLRLGKLLRERGMAQKGQLVEILSISRKHRKANVRPLNGLETMEVSTGILKEISPPEDTVSVRMVKNAGFDQECGCTAVVEFKEQIVEAFNVYGDFQAYLDSRERKGSDKTPHYRRVQLKKKGYVRSKGLKSRVKNPGRRIRKYERNGYEVV